MTLDMMAAQKGSLQAWEAADRLASSWCLGPGLGRLCQHQVVKVA